MRLPFIINIYLLHQQEACLSTLACGYRESIAGKAEICLSGVIDAEELADRGVAYLCVCREDAVIVLPCKSIIGENQLLSVNCKILSVSIAD